MLVPNGLSPSISLSSLGALVEVEQVLAVAGLLEEVLLLGEHEVGVAGHGRPVRHEVRH